MWKLAYNLVLHAFFPIFAAFATTNRKIRKTFFERVFPPPASDAVGDAIWVHAASLGEAVIAENFINYVAEKTTCPFVITTNTYYTRDLLRKKFQQHVPVFSLPFDLPCSINRFIGTARVRALLLIETEIWPNLIWMAKDRGIPVIIVNGRISDSTIHRYKRLSFFLKSVLTSVDLVLAQSEEQARRFISLGMEPSRVIDTGNLKYYRKVQDAHGRPAKENMVTFGSVREKELVDLMPVIARLKKEFPGIRMFIAPRELRLVDPLERQLVQFKVSRYSRIKETGVSDQEIVLVDTVGDLVDIYARSMVAFVGGSLAPYGGQNLLEPLFVGTPVLFGPHIDNFRAVGQNVIEWRAGYMVRDGKELFEKIRLILTDGETRQALIDAGSALVERQNGVMKRTADLVLETIWKNSRNSSN